MEPEELDTVVKIIETIEFKDVEINQDGQDPIHAHLYGREEFKEGQIGYRVDADWNPILEDEEGAWQDDWYVIGYNLDTGEPLFVDVTKVEFPVFTAENGQGEWNPTLLFNSLDDMIRHVKEGDA
ncbi:hypothetical protein [Bacillus litorisediminis]|uniref:hypothetical protein n=1 Tax=Bacillus litorisediminis TaxID=2922713 RepID=UPI001FAD8CEB|nr:hypothetical protein [Bacillus litorisediminis]